MALNYVPEDGDAHVTQFTAEELAALRAIEKELYPQDDELGAFDERKLDAISEKCRSG
jgi:hypothetical protein